MRSIFIIFSMVVAAVQACKQPSSPGKPTVANSKQTAILKTGLDKSPMDISYYPANFPLLKMSISDTIMPLARIIYSRPKRDNRKIFGNVVQYGKQWRIGANEATEIELFTNAVIQRKQVSKGRYVLYCIPNKTNCTLVFNSNLYSWGLQIDSTKDVYSFDAKINKLPYIVEYLSIEFYPLNAKATTLMIRWDDASIEIPIQFQ
jgi:Protein of unknown function (DUF2911)